MTRALAIFIDVALLVLFVGTIGERVHDARDRARFPPPGVLVDVGGGRRLHLQCSGEGSPVIVFESGGTHDATQWDALRETLSRTTRACAYDRAGMGFSDASAGALDARALADDLSALLRGARIEPPFVFVASSAGGLTVELFAREHPAQVAGLVWVDAVFGDLADELGDAEGPLVRRAALAKGLANVGAIAFFDPHGLREERSRARAYHHAAWDATYSIVRSRAASVAQIRAAPPMRDDVPLAVVVHDRAEGAQAEGDVSERWRRAQQRFAARSIRGRFLVALGSGHHPEEDRPELVVEVIRAMVEQHRGM